MSTPASRIARYVLRFVCLAVFFSPSMTRAQTSQSGGQPRLELDAAQATKLAQRMCDQIQNIDAVPFLEKMSDGMSATLPYRPPVEPAVFDDVYDALVALGPYSVPCLTEKLVDARWMPDPREEPLVGAPVVGDVAYMVLMDKGVKDLLPTLGKEPPDMPGMYFYLWWPSIGDHRQRLRNAVRDWVRNNPRCCGEPPKLRSSAPRELKFRMQAADLANARAQFLQLRPGMSSASVLKIAGKPDAMSENESTPENFKLSLLNLGANDHREQRAYIYFVERWADEIGQRDPLRDRYVILYFSSDDKLMRMASTTAEIPAMFPQSAKVWRRLMWGEDADR
jgi:hypothetical protein